MNTHNGKSLAETKKLDVSEAIIPKSYYLRKGYLCLSEIESKVKGIECIQAYPKESLF